MATVNPIQVQKFLKGVDYPASRQEIVQAAKQEGADKDVQETLEKLPDKEFNSPKDISEAIGKID